MQIAWTFLIQGENKLETQQSMMEKLIAKAQEDTNFRGRLVANPNSALKDAFDIEVPEDFNVVIHEEDARTAHLVLPASRELTDTQLQQAAGGFEDCTKGPFDMAWDV